MIVGKSPLIIIILLLLLLSNITLGQAAPQYKENHLAELDTTIWKYLSVTDRFEWTITKADSEKALKTYFFNGAKIFRDFKDIYKKIEKGRLSLEEAIPNLIKLLEEVKEYFEEGLKLNPFDTYIRTGISTVYTYLEELYARTDDDIKRLQMIKNLLYLEKDQKNRIDLFNKAGNIYFSYQFWEEARANFQNAVNTIFEEENSVIDTAGLFNNIYLRGMSQLKLYQDEPALTSFVYARMIAPDENWYNTLTNWIDFINWDNGNIRASEQYQNARKLYSEKKYEEVEKVFLDLLKIINTEKAQNEVDLRLSRIQFYFLEKKEEAIDRLWNAVKNFPLNAHTGAQLDSSQKDYCEMYCQMCLQMANKYYPTNKKIAFTYFQKISQIKSSTRGSAFLNLAIMSVKNPEICLEYCNRAFEYLEQLSKDEQKKLFRTFYLVHKTKGNFEEALKWFQKFHAI